MRKEYMLSYNKSQLICVVCKNDTFFEKDIVNVNAEGNEYINTMERLICAKCKHILLFEEGSIKEYY